MDLETRGEVGSQVDTPAYRPGWQMPEDDGADSPHERLRVHRGFHSSILPDDRDLIVYLPPGYEAEPERSYPVLYMHDGQNLFDPATSYVKGRTWMVREHADAAIESGEVDPLIIVGIYNTGDRRLAEYTPERDWQMGGGEADAYGALLTQELMPWIAERYRIRREREHTGLGGSSLGGLVSLYLGLKYADTFGRLAVLSPSVWWNHKSILGFVNEVAPYLENLPHIWLDTGDHEGRMTLKDTDMLAKRLRQHGWEDEETLHFEKVRGGTHEELSWATRVRPMLRFLFPTDI
ncbi:MAG TPA: alpha/beta hydrolase-fold protein [Acidobacteriaceae bacterium]|nr:alpha/beta hydrolase-fold protein [Acidobacteriaceae bacterium]